VTNDRIETHIVIILYADELTTAVFGLGSEKPLSQTRS
jgi:hypothetical protein